MRASNNSINNIRFAGMQLLETWLSLLEEYESLVSIEEAIDYCECLLPRVAAISRLLTVLWGHPAKLIAHIVPVVYQRLVDFISRSKFLRLTAEGGYLTHILESLIKEALSQPSNHRGRYQSLNSLLPKASPELFVSSQPLIVADLIKAISMREVSSAATKLLGTLLRYLRDRDGYVEDRLRRLWGKHAVAALCSEERHIRQTTAEYLITELLSTDPSCGSFLIQVIRNEEAASYDRKLFAIMNVVLHCRLRNLVGQEITNPNEDSAALSLSELRLGCISGDIDIRLTSLLVIVASHKPITPLVERELVVFMETFIFSLKDSEADHRHRILRIVKTLILRVKETYRVAERDGRKIAEKVNNIKRSSENDGIKTIDQFEELSETLFNNWKNTERVSMNLYQWLSEVLARNVFPGMYNCQNCASYSPS